MAVSAADLATFTGRQASDATVIEATTVSLSLLTRYYVVDDPLTPDQELAQKHIGRWLLQARQGELVDGGDLGTIYLPNRLPAVEKLVERIGGFA